MCQIHMCLWNYCHIYLHGYRNVFFLISRMAATAFHQAIGTLQSRGYLSNEINHECGNASVKLISKGFNMDVGLLRSGSYCTRKRSFSLIKASSAQTTVFNPISTPSNSTANDSRKKSSKTSHSYLILMRN